MTSTSLDGNAVNPMNAPNLFMYVIRHLVGHGYGTIRFYTYIKEGLGALKIAMYLEMREQGRNGEPLAIPFFLDSFSSFDDPGHSAYWREYTQKQLSVAEVAEIFKKEMLSGHSGWQSAPSDKYLAWLDSVIAVCGNNGFPITEEPGMSGFGTGGVMIECMFADHRPVVFLPRPPKFAETLFPVNEYNTWSRNHEIELAKAKPKANYSEWKRRIAEIQENASGR
jgi:hypothetical protein